MCNICFIYVVELLNGMENILWSYLIQYSYVSQCGCIGFEKTMSNISLFFVLLSDYMIDID